MYVAAVRFADRQDGNRIYEPGERYPRLGLSVTDERIAELTGSDNRAGYPLIKRIETPVKRAENEAEEIPTETPKTPKKAVRSRKKG